MRYTIIALAMSALTLCGACSSFVNDCQPDASLMAQAGPLPPLPTDKPLTEQDILKDWAEDMGAYAELRDRHNRLAVHVHDYCQNKPNLLQRILPGH